MSQTTRPWLKKVHKRRRDHTVALVRSAVQTLRRSARRISIASIVATTREVDPERVGISATTLLNNPVAYDLYTQARTWQPARGRRIQPAIDTTSLPDPVKLERDIDAARHRLAKLTKDVLITKLLTIEQAYGKLYRATMIEQARNVDEWISQQAASLSTEKLHNPVDK
ncbi:hypothetical protein M3I54_35990 [Paraburkholderia sp. CNPSo 3274]|uniref:hypothetical protein n=1 Tax=Paraburkholderia sp. CNPSo 3274 TaxID=2940932 RepID=UPI0020B7782C|nr:hypothetical protein [Paraburkholderia sp. CNPSo 3274]MCP3712284.1 hypothetical protein [Paraburkholderia sp. CNPSo 3274]